MKKLLERLFPICRSLTGEGVRETLKILQEIIPLKINSIKSGKKVFDWTIPQEWNIKNAYIKDNYGNIYADFKINNLHVVGYSEPINKIITKEELLKHIHTLPDQPEAIPYVTSYYKRNWGFCLQHNKLKELKEDQYHIIIDSELKDGELNYAELYIKGKIEKEVLISTYICHPSMANNELSGPVVTAYLAKELLNKDNYYSYRFIFIPETIGSIAYLATNNLKKLKQSIIAGYVITCVGGNDNFYYMPTRQENNFIDILTKNVLNHEEPLYRLCNFSERGSDERQYNYPGIDLPVSSIMKTMYGKYTEYHTSLDNLDFINEKQLKRSLNIYLKCIEAIEICHKKYKTTTFCEPQLGKRGLYSDVSIKGSWSSGQDLLNVLTYCDGNNNILYIAEKINKYITDVYDIIKILEKHNLIKKIL